MGEDDPLWIPSDHLPHRGLEFLAVAGKGSPHVTRHASMRVLHSAQSREPAHEDAVEPRRLEILDQVREYKRPARMVEELDFRHVAAGNRQGRKLIVPRIAVVCRKLLRREVDAALCLLTDSRRQIDLSVGIGVSPFGNPPVVDAVRPHDPARHPQPVHLLLQVRYERRRRMKEKAVCQPDHGHPCWKRHLRPGHAETNQRSVDDPDILGNGL